MKMKVFLVGPLRAPVYTSIQKKALLLGLMLTLFSLALAGCGSPVGLPLFGPSPTPTASPTPTLTPTPIPTPTPTPSPTPVPAVRVAQGDQALTNGDWDAALSEFQAAQQNSTDPDIQSAALLGVGRTRLLAGNPFEAINVFESFLAAFPNSPNLPYAYFYLGQAHSAVEHYSEAAEAYLNYLALRPGVVDGYVLGLRGDALFAEGDYAGAAQDFQRRAAIALPGPFDHP